MAYASEIRAIRGKRINFITDFVGPGAIYCLVIRITLKTRDSAIFDVSFLTFTGGDATQASQTQHFLAAAAADVTGVRPLSIRKLALAAVLSASLSSVPVMAQTTAYQPVAAERAGLEMTEANAQDGGFPFLIVFVVIAVGLGLYFAVDNNGSDEPTSP